MKRASTALPIGPAAKLVESELRKFDKELVVKLSRNQSRILLGTAEECFLREEGEKLYQAAIRLTN